MKKGLLLFCACVLSALTALAQTWVAPSLQLTNDSVPAKAAIYNVQQERFLTKGGAWGTHAALGPAESAFVYEMQAQSEGVYKLYCAAAAGQHLMGREGAKDVYTDYNNQNGWSTLWQFVKVEATGNYHIMTAASCPNFGADKFSNDETYDEEFEGNPGKFLLAWSENEQDLKNGNGEPMGTNVGCYMLDPENPENEGMSAEWCFVSEEAFAVYDAQLGLYNKLNEALETGYSEAELASYASKLTETDVEVLRATTAEVDKLILSYAYDHATPDEPYDVTSVITNPGFDGTKGGTPAGWICTNAVLQNNKAYEGWDDEAGAPTTEPVFNCQIEQWTSGAYITAAADVRQIISDLPQGTYRLTGWCIATAGSSDYVPNGAELYAESGVIRYSTPVSMPYGAEGSGYPHLTTVEITHLGGDLTIGYAYNPGQVKWWAADNFKLYYCGPVDNPGLLALSATYATAQQYVDAYENAETAFSAATYEALREGMSAADAVMGGGSSDACTDAATVLNDIIASAKAESVVYGKFAAFLEQVSADAVRYENSVTSLYDTVAELKEQYQNAYDDREASTEQLEAWMAGYAQTLSEAVLAALAEATPEQPVEVTPLFANMAFEENGAESKTPNGWTCAASAFKARANTAEVWNSTFDCYRQLEGLPAGAYKLTAKALSRYGGNVANYEQFISDPDFKQSARLYLNAKSVPVADQASGATPEKRYANDANVGTEEEPLWVPNSMEGARVYFNIEELYNNEVIGVSLNDGDPITVGIKHEGEVPADSWTIWSDFRVYFLGKSNTLLYETMVALAETADAKAAEAVTKEGEQMLYAAIDASNKETPTSSEEALTAVINTLNDALAYNEEAEYVFDQLTTMLDDYQERLYGMDIDSDYKGLYDLLDEVDDAASSLYAESIAQMEAWMEAMPVELTKHVQYPALGTASEENPADITPVLTNPCFDAGWNNTAGAYGWNIEWTNGTGGHIGWNNTTQQQGSQYAYEFWDVTAFKLSQTVVGLADGYYRLSCNNLYRNGDNTDEVSAEYEANPAAVRKLYLFANEASKPGNSIYDFPQAEDPEWDGEGKAVLNGTEVFLPNTMVSGGAAFAEELYLSSLEFQLKEGEQLTLGLRLVGEPAAHCWSLFDNFRLEYLGTTTPSAIDDVTVDAPARPAAIYDLQGRRVERMQKGLYIQGGRTLLVK